MLDQWGLSRKTINQVKSVFSRYPQVERAILYGSRAKGGFKKGSDLDLTLVGGEDLNFEMLLKIMSALDDLPIPYTIDLSILKDIEDPDVVEHIQRVGVTFYERNRVDQAEADQT